MKIEFTNVVVEHAGCGCCGEGHLLLPCETELEEVLVEQLHEAIQRLADILGRIVEVAGGFLSEERLKQHDLVGTNWSGLLFVPAQDPCLRVAALEEDHAIGGEVDER